MLQRDQSRLVRPLGKSMTLCPIAIIGAGPYGLSAAAHLRECGVETRVFGEPMSFWERCMPEGLVLRSPWAASQISDPKKKLTLDAYQTSRSIRISLVFHFCESSRYRTNNKFRAILP